ncbi:MAG: DUF971 domain-containing protein, partial [Burkholderiales bacterium]
MAGSDSGAVSPTRVVVHQGSRVLEIEFSDGKLFRLPFELLRVYSPSAEVRGHGPGQEVLQTGKADVGVESVESVGHYALQPRFSDGHDTGIFSWDYLYWLGDNHEQLWQQYLARIEAAGASRQAAAPIQAELEELGLEPGTPEWNGKRAEIAHRYAGALPYLQRTARLLE